MKFLRVPILIVYLFVALIAGATISDNTPTTKAVLGAANGYYKDADGKKGANLFSALHTISGGVTYSYKKLTYKELWTAYATSDVYPQGSEHEGKIWDMYSTCYYTPIEDQGSSSSTECEGGYNREHSLPKSWWGNSGSAYESTNYGCDLGHVVPTDVHVNTGRSNYAFGEVKTVSIQYNISKKGTSGTSLSVEKNTIAGKSTTFSEVTVFEPTDEYKGDFARMYMYMRARYDDLNFAQEAGGKVHFTTTTDASSDSKYGLTDYSVILLMKWHRQDPVSQKEIDRNNAMERLQGNRNPFIDYPILAEYLWGDKNTETFYLTNALGSFDSNFQPGISDGSNDGVGPVLPTYSIEWMADGTRIQVQQVDEGTSPTPPNVSNCSASRVFAGWTAYATISSKPTDLFTEAPEATKNATYYAVYADKEGTSLDTFEKATSLSIGDNVVIVCEKVSKEMLGVPGTNCGDLVAGLPTGGYTLQVVAGSTTGTYAFKRDNIYLSRNGATLTTSASITELSSWTVSFNNGNARITNVADASRSIWWNKSAPRFACYTISSETSSYYAVQLYKKAAGSGVTYSNYSLKCTECTPVAATASFAEESLTAAVCDVSVSNTFTTNSTAEVNFTSSNTNVADVDAFTGEVTIKGVGEATITADVPATQCYTAASASYTLTVNDFLLMLASDVQMNAFTANWTSAGTTSYTMDVTYEGIMEIASTEDATYYSKDFKTDINNWTVRNVSGYSNVWYYNSSFNCAYAASYVNKTRYDAESWLVSPAISLEDAASATMTLNHVFRYSGTVSVKISTDGGTSWDDISLYPWSISSSWDMVNSTADLSEYVGQTIQVALVYIGNQTACPTWEIETFTISGEKNVLTYVPAIQHVSGYPKTVTGTSRTVTGLTPSTVYNYVVTADGCDVSRQASVTTSGCEATITILSDDMSMGTVEFED